MKFLVRVSSEITIKSPSVRKNLIRILRRNLQKNLSSIGKEIHISGSWDGMHIEIPQEYQKEGEKILHHTAGIEWYAPITSFPLKNNNEDTKKISQESEKIFDDILEKVLNKMEKEITGKTFCVRVHRTGKHCFSSMDAEKYIGGGINQKIKTAKVQLKNPEKEVSIIIKDNTVFLRGKKKRGIGGYPVGSQGKVLCLLSGGFDSGVVAQMMMNRGCKVDFLFCNLGGMAHEAGVRKMAHILWKTFSRSFDVKFFSVPFEPVIAELLEKTEEKYRGVLLKRMMFRVAEKVARTKRYKAVVTGESLAQVSSQTLENLRVIEKATEMLVFRPLIAMNKQEIIAKAEKIGTAEIAKIMPEYCGVVSKKPSAKARLQDVTQEEKKCDMEVIENAFSHIQMYLCNNFTKNDFLIPEVEIVTEVKKDEVIIDIREAEEIEEEPITNIENGHDRSKKILKIPFYEVQETFPKLEQEKTYLLYCERGIVSRAQAELLIKKGFRNVKVLRR